MSIATALLTVDEYAALPDFGHPTDLVHGQIIDMPPPSPRHGELCGRVAFLLQLYLQTHPLGRIATNDSCVVTERNPDTVRTADVAYYSYNRVPRGPLPTTMLSVAPELVCEVLSPHDRWSEVLAKVAEYLRCGVHAVCVMDDTTRSLHLFHVDRPAQLLSGDLELQIPALLPDLRIPVRQFFE